MRLLVAIAAALVIMGLGFTATEALALAPGVHVSPSSPAGSQYSFPLGVQRSQGAGHSTGSGGAQPLFGVGVKSVSPASSGTGPSSSAAGAAKGATSATGTATQPGSVARGAAGQTAGGQVGQGSAAPSQASLASLARPGSSVPLLALIVGGTVVAGLALGLALAVVRARRSG